MSRHVERELVALRREFTAHATSCFEALERAHEALRDRDAALARRVVAGDAQVDREEVHIEQECVRLITLYHPVAQDMRLLITMLKLNHDLERIADHAANIAKLAEKVMRADGRVPAHLLDLSQRVLSASRDAFQAFLDRDLEAAQRVLAGDAGVDRLDRRVRHEVHDLLEKDADIGAALAAYRVSRELERIGDHLANVAEDTIYLITGEIVRHTPPELAGPAND